ncbi:MAG: HAD-IA family hydrolase [Myxococcales bacterium]|nr:HAD-IA family hydrolase [Myxococcales bacterium]
MAMDGNHLGFVVRDLFRMEKFYRTVFGLRLLYRYESVHTPGLRTVFLVGRGLVLELLHYADRPAPETPADHLSFAVPNIKAEHERLAALGVDGLTEPRLTGDGYWEVALRDPEGRRIEIAERVRPYAYPPIRAIVFDLDGTLIDSEPNYYEADRRLLAEYGIELTPAMKRRYIGTSNVFMMTDVKERFGLQAELPELLEKKDRYYLELALAETRPFPEMARLVTQLRDRGYPLAVASGSSLHVIQTLLKQVGLQNAFRVVVSAEEVPRGKPSPDVFLEAARRLGAEPMQTIVVEDSAFGVEAAAAGFMRVVAVPSVPEPPLEPSFQLADLLFAGGISDFTTKKFLDWLGSGAMPRLQPDL